MSSTILLLAAFAVTASAQTSPRSTNTTANDSTSAAAQAGRASASAQQAADVSARLTKSINSKHAKVGDEVLAKTTQQARLADGTTLPKGSRLVGHVTQVAAKSHAQHDGQLAFSFDHALLRNGREVPIHAVMESVSAPAPPSVSDDMMGDGGVDAGPVMAGGGGRMGGGVSRGGGLVSGAAAPVGGALRGSTGVVGNTASGLNAAGNGAVSSAGSVGRNTAALNGTASGNSAFSGQAFPVGNLSGVTFANLHAASAAGRLTSNSSASGSASASRRGITGSAGAQNATLFTARGRNVDLAGGSQMTMSVTPESH